MRWISLNTKLSCWTLGLPLHSNPIERSVKNRRNPQGIRIFVQQRIPALTSKESGRPEGVPERPLPRRQNLYPTPTEMMGYSLNTDMLLLSLVCSERIWRCTEGSEATLRQFTP